MALRSKFRPLPTWKPKARPRFVFKRKENNLCVKQAAKGRGRITRVAAVAQRKSGRRLNRLPEWTDPRSYITKGGRHRLFGQDYYRLRFDACVRANGFCECGCGRRAYFDDISPLKDRGDIAHKKHGPRKSDELKEVLWKRRECHDREHNPKPIQVTKKSLKGAA